MRFMRSFGLVIMLTGIITAGLDMVQKANSRMALVFFIAGMILFLVCSIDKNDGN